MQPDRGDMKGNSKVNNDDVRKIIDWNTFRMFCSKRIEETMSKIDKTWWELGLNQTDTKQRRSQLAIGFDEYCSALSCQEDKFMEEIYFSLKETVRENRLLSLELDLPHPEVDITLRPMELKAEVDKLLKILTEERAYRLNMFDSLKTRIRDASEVMRCPVGYGVPVDETRPLQPRSCLELMEKRLKILEAEINEREANHNLLKASIIDLLGKLGINSYDDQYVKILHPTKLILSNEVMDSIQCLQNDVFEKNNTLKKCCDSLWLDIEKWWKKLDVDDYQKSFTYEKLKGKHGPDVINQLENLKRELIELRFTKMEDCIARNQNKFNDFSKKTYMTYNSRIYDVIGLKDVKRYIQDSEWAGKCNESYLVYLEDAVEKLVTYYEDNKTLFTMIERREEIWNELCRFENTPLDKDRFRNRRGILLQEEKTRNRIYKELPRLQEELILHLSNWSNKYTLPGSVSSSDPNSDIVFLWEDGYAYSERLTKQWEDRKCKTLPFAKNDSSIKNLSSSHNDISRIGLSSPIVRNVNSPTKINSSKRTFESKTPVVKRTKQISPAISDTRLDYSLTETIEKKLKNLPSVPKTNLFQFKSPISIRSKVNSPISSNNQLKSANKENVKVKKRKIYNVINIFKEKKKPEEPM